MMRLFLLSRAALPASSGISAVKFQGWQLKVGHQRRRGQRTCLLQEAVMTDREPGDQPGGAGRPTAWTAALPCLSPTGTLGCSKVLWVQEQTYLIWLFWTD
jgi:hypothetical protein